MLKNKFSSSNILNSRIKQFGLFLYATILVFPVPLIIAIIIWVEKPFHGWVWLVILLFIFPVFSAIIAGYISFVIFKKIYLKNVDGKYGNFSDLVSNIINKAQQNQMASVTTESHKEKDSKISKSENIEEVEIIEEENE